MGLASDKACFSCAMAVEKAIPIQGSDVRRFRSNTRLSQLSHSAYVRKRQYAAHHYSTNYRKAVVCYNWRYV